jgi:hypothetical protein
MTERRLMPAAEAADCEAIVDRAIALAPDCMEAYEMLAIIELEKPDMRVEKINTVLEALPNMRERAGTCRSLATIYWRAKRPDDAETMLGVLEKDPRASRPMLLNAYEPRKIIAKETGREPPSPPKPPPVPGQIQENQPATTQTLRLLIPRQTQKRASTKLPSAPRPRCRNLF